MRLALLTRQSAGNSLVVGEGGPAAVQLLSDSDHEQGFLEMYRRLHGPAKVYAERFVGWDDARDAVAEAMLDLWRQWPTLTPGRRTDRYVFAVVHNHVWKQLKENSQLVSFGDAEVELDEMAVRAVSEGSVAGTRVDILEKALAAMPPRRREIFVLVREQGFSYGEAAEALGLHEGTINTHMRLANEDVRAAFAAAGYQLPKQPRRLNAPKGGDAND